ncbi:hypothetical protein BN1047_01978 [Mycolicibacterium neoaurum]|uniref:Uncharacterized protein n=1 Tax=Mycolicibacterium neoaurum TaxID=1795 RepID=A0AAV2WJL1_MYCNE|nr:hypothetical protein BN1047_01978 [Mycolicibacterium neoaurum]
MGVATGELQRARAMPAASDGPALRTRQRRDVTASGHLHQHRVPGFQGRACRPQCHRRQPGGMGGRIAGVIEGVVVQRDHPRGVLAHHRPGGHQVVRPPTAHQRMRLGGAGIAADDCRTTQLVGPQHRDVARVRIRCARLGQRVVAVVPDGDQAQLGDGCEHRAAGADHQPGLPAQHRQPAAVPLRRPQPGRQRHRLVPDEGDRGAVHGIDITLVGHDDQRAATGPHGHRGDLGEPVGPVLTGQGLPHRARGAAVTQGGDELLAAAVRAPRGAVDRREIGLLR